MKRIRIILMIMFFLPAYLFSQEIIIKDNEKEKTTIIFSTTTGEYVPIYRTLGSINFSTYNSHVKLIELEKIADAPVMIELEQGFYSFQIYEKFGRKFEINASGGIQEWMIKPKGRLFNQCRWATGISGFLTIASAFFLAISLGADSMPSNSDPDFAFYDPTYVSKTPLAITALGTSCGVVIISGILFLSKFPNIKRIR